MKMISNLFRKMSERSAALVQPNAVVAQTISVGDRHVIPLCELAFGAGVGGGRGEGEDEVQGKGEGGGAGGMAKASPVAVVVVDGTSVKIQSLDG